ncbi:MAG: hypothetical protein S4CHLAM6_11310 [Chlamydiae bacterium]|nr:hypothetical protein [Chlamydiota bacterium]
MCSGFGTQFSGGWMNKVEAKRIFSSILQLLKNEDPRNFEKDYSENMVAHINSEDLNLQDLRMRFVFFVENFEVVELKVEDFIFENNKAGIRFYLKARDRKDGTEIDDNLFYIYHFENNQVKESWVLTKLPVNNKTHNE